ncbi:hypothetical protein Mapa_001621 [Marchantia paleacea]|nr:hypothetical protein Mapa_001621 [Marchantia paleacea]
MLRTTTTAHYSHSKFAKATHSAGRPHRPLVIERTHNLGFGHETARTRAQRKHVVNGSKSKRERVMLQVAKPSNSGLSSFYKALPKASQCHVFTSIFDSETRFREVSDSQ